MKLYQWAALVAAMCGSFACSASSESVGETAQAVTPVDQRVVVNSSNWPTAPKQRALSFQSASSFNNFSVGDGMWQSASNLCLDADFLGNGALVRMQNCDPQKATQHWSITSIGATRGSWAFGQALTNNGYVISGKLGQALHLDQILGHPLNLPQYTFNLDHMIIRRADQDACMDAGPPGTLAGTAATFSPCHHEFGQIWMGFGGYNVAITSGLQADSSGRPFYIQEDRGPNGRSGLQIHQNVCTTGTGSATRCSPAASQVFNLAPFFGSLGAAIHVGSSTLYWYNDPLVQGPVQFNTQAQLWISNKWGWDTNSTNPGPGVIQTTNANGNFLCSMAPNTNGGGMQMVNPNPNPNQVRDCDWYWVYQSSP